MQILSGLPSSDKRSEPLKVYIPSLNIVPILFMAAGGPATAMDHRAQRAGVGAPLGSGPLADQPGFRSVVLGQLGANHASRASRLKVGRLTPIPRDPLRA